MFRHFCQYVALQIKPVSPFATYAEGAVDCRGNNSSLVNPENISTDDDILNEEPRIKPRPRLVPVYFQYYLGII